jgi:hypothetical protein
MNMFEPLFESLWWAAGLPRRIRSVWENSLKNSPAAGIFQGFLVVKVSFSGFARRMAGK